MATSHTDSKKCWITANFGWKWTDDVPWKTVRSPKISSNHHKDSDVKDAYDFEENCSVKFKRKQTLFLNWYFIFIKHELTKLISKHKYGGKN